MGRLEEHVRRERERRNEPGWRFIPYFRLQEELALVLEMLGLHDEALVQYDELDALFSQFVVNGHAGDAADWLGEFQSPLETWKALVLPECGIDGKENEFSNSLEPLVDNPSLLELRAYLFARQARALLLTGRPWEMAGRCLPFLHACVRELALLEVSSPPGAVACWLFLGCLEVLHACDRFNDAGHVEAYSLHTAGLWAYASSKLRELGELCGLSPGSPLPTSEQLHAVVGLSAGMGDRPGKPGHPSPTDKLKEALCSRDVFKKHYLELCELAMGTYKHIGRLRSARLVGRELAAFYRQLGEPQKAAAFLGDALKTFEQDNWKDLAAHAQLELAACYAQGGDVRRHVRACSAVAAAPEVDTLVRCAHFDDMLKSMERLDRMLIIPFGNIFKIISVTINGDPMRITQDSHLQVDLLIDCNFPRKIVCSNLVISLEVDKERPKKENHVRIIILALLYFIPFYIFTIRSIICFRTNLELFVQ